MPFSFNASYYTEQELTEKGHNYELEKSGHVIWHLDYGMSGVGSNSCGPVLLEKYRLDEEEIIGDDFMLIHDGERIVFTGIPSRTSTGSARWGKGWEKAWDGLCAPDSHADQCPASPGSDPDSNTGVGGNNILDLAARWQQTCWI